MFFFQGWDNGGLQRLNRVTEVIELVSDRTGISTQFIWLWGLGFTFSSQDWAWFSAEKVLPGSLFNRCLPEASLVQPAKIGLKPDGGCFSKSTSLRKSSFFGNWLQNVMKCCFVPETKSGTTEKVHSCVSEVEPGQNRDFINTDQRKLKVTWLPAYMTRKQLQWHLYTQYSKIKFTTLFIVSGIVSCINSWVSETNSPKLSISIVYFTSFILPSVGALKTTKLALGL